MGAGGLTGVDQAICERKRPTDPVLGHAGLVCEMHSISPRRRSWWLLVAPGGSIFVTAHYSEALGTGCGKLSTAVILVFEWPTMLHQRRQWSTDMHEGVG